jgi:hypothetical protein
MTNVEDRLHRLGADLHAAEVSRLAGSRTSTAELARADLGRSRTARTRRRVRVGVAGLGVAAVAVVGTTAVVAHQPQDTTVAPTPRISAPDRTGTTIELVAYEGEQQPGFVIDKVPEGFVLQGATPFHLNVTRPGDDSHIDDFRDKLVVMLESRSVTGAPKGEPVDVGGLDGWLRDSGGGALVLTYLDGEHRVVVQAWETLGLTGDQLVEFAEGVTVTDEAQAGVG